MHYGMELTHNEIVDILDVEYIAGSTEGYTLPPGVHEITDINLMLESLLPKQVKVKITIDDIRLKTDLTINTTIRFTKKSFFCTILGPTESHSGVLCNISGFVQLIPGSYKSDKPTHITGIDKVTVKANMYERINC